MCGIIGYKGKRNANEVVLKGLKRLEYRGYDSWGIAALNDKINVVKDVGKIGKVSLEELELKESNISIGHTRWSTHGSVNEINAHPQLSQNNKIAVVHNGIIENYQELRDFLKKQGYEFKSQTDTEVIPNYIQYFMDKGDDFSSAIKKILNELEGSFAVVAIHAEFDKVIGARRGSPLVVGLGKDEFFIASDVPAFLEYCSNVIYLDDDELVEINESIEIFDLKTNKKISKQSKKIEWTLEQAQKGNYPYFMLKEIYEQKFTIKKAIEQSPVLIEKITKMIKEAYGVFFVGCGTSYHACVSASYTFSHIAKKHINVAIASEFRNYEDFLTNKTLMVAVSQSGETADLLDAVKVAKKKGVKIIAICNVVGSTLTRMADEVIMMNSGPEICVLSTKSYTSQIAILVLLAYSVAGRYEKGKQIVEDACSNVEKIINDNESVIKEIAKKTKNSKDYFLIGRDLAYPSALEGALKIKEVSYIHAEGFAGGELKHGTIALIEKDVPVIVFVTKWTKKLILSNTMEIKSRGGLIIGINEENNELYDYFIKTPELGNANPIIMIIPLQLLAYYLAVGRGCDPDFPKNLAKCVSVK